MNHSPVYSSKDITKLYIGINRMADETKNLVELAKQGNSYALEKLILKIQNRIFRFALKMMQHRSDAEDTSQEILIKIITKLDSFRGESSFETWALTISANHIKNRLSRRAKKQMTFKDCENEIIKQIPDNSTQNFKAEEDLVVEEMRIACMQSLLQCLDTDHRLAYILGSTLELNSLEGAAVLEISPPAFRKRLSRARTRLRDFLSKNCDLFNKNNPCNCAVQSISAIKKGAINPEALNFAGKPISTSPAKNIKASLQELDELARATAIMKINQDFQAPETFIQGIQELIETRTI